MTDDPNPPAMTGPSPSERGLPAVPADPALHAIQSAHEWENVLESYAKRRMKELGIPEHPRGATDFNGDGRWKAFIAHGRSGGNLTDGISVSSGCLNPELLKGKPGVRVFANARLRDRIYAIVAHEFEEDRLGTHELAIKHGSKTDLSISDGARRILRAMGR